MVLRNVGIFLRVYTASTTLNINAVILSPVRNSVLLLASRTPVETSRAVFAKDVEYEASS
jgi:hypothetical protein